jgi:hypothetical protein
MDMLKVMNPANLAAQCGRISFLPSYCIGHIAHIYPRVGWSINPMESKNAQIVAFRTISMANRGGGVKLGSYGFTIKNGGQIQTFAPKISKCYEIGTGSEMDKKANDKSYMYIHFPKVKCCPGCHKASQADG